AKEEGVSIRNISLKKIVLIGESIRNQDFSSNSLGKLVEGAWGKKCFSTYGITEAALSFCECSYHNGLHSHPDLVIAEIVDDKGNPLKDGETGELVVTPLQVEGMPFIRYKTGDITFKISEKCRCGRTSLRIGPIIGRKHQRLKVKGVTLYPKTIENALLEIKDIVNYQIEAYTGPDYTDHVRVLIGAHRKDPSFQKIVCDRLKAKARLTPEVKIMLPKEIEKELYKGGSRKALTFNDRRTA
ncbi:MAG: phenylacetate--CoA ligase family protein, partial [Nitrospirae bacterium]